MLMRCTTLMRSCRVTARRQIAAILVILTASSALAAATHAATEAYWRHEEGPAGALIPPGAGTVLDSSGNNNHMRTFDPTFTSATYSASVSPLNLRDGLANTLSLDFGPGGDDPGLNDDNYSEGAPINSKLFSAMTVELAFNMNSIGGYQALFGKDGQPTAGPVPPFKILVRGDDFPNAIPNQLFVEWIDGDGDVHFLASGETVTANTWNHVAFVLSDSTAELYVAGETGNYRLLDSLVGEDFAGPSGEVLINSEGNFSIGRGMFNNGVSDWANALIDEVRISDVALTRDQFAFVVPEPTSLCLAALGLVGLLRRGLRQII